LIITVIGCQSASEWPPYRCPKGTPWHKA
jgi:hypothetical protein